jgi:AraC-like DNA-binding protein
MHIIDIMRIEDAVFVYQMQDDDEIRWHGRYHQHGTAEYELHYFLQGTGQFQNGSDLCTIVPGTLFITSPGTFHAIRASDSINPITYYAVLFSVDPHEQQMTELLHQDIHQASRSNIGTNYRFFFEEIREKGLSQIENLRRSAVHQLISFLYQLSEGEMSSYSREESVHLEKALRFMQKNVIGSITLSDIASRLGLTESYFIRLFQRRMKTSPMKYYTRLKVEAAGAMLAGTNLSVKEIAARLCFYSEFHFSRVFKQYTGHAPSHYRARYLQSLDDSRPLMPEYLSRYSSASIT